jgi:hypothetical protein
MGAGASSLPRLRKALAIRAYNARKATDKTTLFEQFLPFAVQRADNRLYYIDSAQIKTCLGLDSQEYAWLDDLLVTLFRQPGGNEQGPGIYLYDFVQFLETGKVVSKQPIISPILCLFLNGLTHTGCIPSAFLFQQHHYQRQPRHQRQWSQRVGPRRGQCP